MNVKMINNDVINKIIEFADNHPDIAAMWLYGSQATQQSHPNSDYDLAIAFVSFPQAPITRHLRPAILAIDWASTLKLPSKKISLIDINLVPIPFAWEIITTGYIIYRNNTLRADWEEKRIGSQMELDILWHRKQYG
jgi:predicted nucleotidyltransferase